MASGPQHFDSAQTYLDAAWDLANDEEPNMERANFLVSVAAVHVQMAAVAVHHDFSEARKYVPNSQEWKRVTEEDE